MSSGAGGVGGAFGLSEKTLAELHRIFSDEPCVHRVLVYGSRAKGGFREGSDIDLTIDSPSLSFSQLIHLQGEIEDSMIPQMVDLSILQNLTNPALLEHIQRVSKVFYERKK